MEDIYKLILTKLEKFPFFSCIMYVFFECENLLPFTALFNLINKT
jgi:hypothetical protein